MHWKNNKFIKYSISKHDGRGHLGDQIADGMSIIKMVPKEIGG
jgi:hypothetical protein